MPAVPRLRRRLVLGRAFRSWRQPLLCFRSPRRAGAAEPRPLVAATRGRDARGARCAEQARSLRARPFTGGHVTLARGRHAAPRHPAADGARARLFGCRRSERELLLDGAAEPARLALLRDPTRAEREV